MIKKMLNKPWVARSLFALYLIVLLYLLFFSEHYGRTEKLTEYRYNLIPFVEIKRYILHRDRFTEELFLVNIVGNVVAFIPFGVFSPLVLPKRMRHFVTVLAMSYLFSLSVECLQMLSLVGIFDLDDIILNTLGGVVGYWVYWLWLRKRAGKKQE